MSRELGVQFAREGIRVNALCPGPVNTPLLQELFAKDPERAARRLVHIPVGRFAERRRDRRRRGLPRERRLLVRQRHRLPRRRRHLGGVRHPLCRATVRHIGVRSPRQSTYTRTDPVAARGTSQEPVGTPSWWRTGSRAAVLAAAGHVALPPPTAGPARSSPQKLGSSGTAHNRARLQQHDRRARHAATATTARAPVAAFDWDNTVVKNDVSDATIVWSLQHDKILRPAELDGTTSRWLTDDAATALTAACGTAVPRRRAPAHRHRRPPAPTRSSTSAVRPAP